MGALKLFVTDHLQGRCSRQRDGTETLCKSGRQDRQRERDRGEEQPSAHRSLNILMKNDAGEECRQ